MVWTRKEEGQQLRENNPLPGVTTYQGKNNMHGKPTAISLSWLGNEPQPCWMFQGFCLFVMTRTKVFCRWPEPIHSTEVQGNPLLLLLFPGFQRRQTQCLQYVFGAVKEGAFFPIFLLEKKHKPNQALLTALFYAIRKQKRKKKEAQTNFVWKEVSSFTLNLYVVFMISLC